MMSTVSVAQELVKLLNKCYYYLVYVCFSCSTELYIYDHIMAGTYLFENQITIITSIKFQVTTKNGCADRVLTACDICNIG
jgi:hypothetical protein